MKYFKPHIFQPLLRLVTQFSTFVIWRFLGVPLLSAIPDLETQFGAVPHWRVLRVLLSTVLDLVVPQVGVVSDHASNILTQTCDPGCHICDLVGALLYIYYPPCHSKLVPCRILEATFAAAGSHSLSPQIGAKVTSFQMVNTHKQTDFKPV